MFYVTEIAEGDEKVAGKAIYEYGTAEKAEASYHKKIGIAMDSELYTSHLCMAYNEDGCMLVPPHKWVRPTVNEPIEE